FFEITTKEAFVIRNRLENYLIDTYYTESAKTDKKECEDVCEKIYKRVKVKIEASYLELVEKSNKDIDNKIFEQKKRIKGYSYEILNLKKSIEEVIEELSKLKS